MPTGSAREFEAKVAHLEGFSGGLDEDRRRRMGRLAGAALEAELRRIAGLDAGELAAPRRAAWLLPEGRYGLRRLLEQAFPQAKVIAARGVDRIRLMSEAEARDQRRLDARSADVATAISAGLLQENCQEFRFLPPRTLTVEKEALLYAVAKDVYFSGTSQALGGLELLCDDDTHFGADRMHDKARQLLARVWREFDQQDRRLSEMPSDVEAALLLVMGVERRAAQGKDW